MTQQGHGIVSRDHEEKAEESRGHAQATRIITCLPARD